MTPATPTYIACIGSRETPPDVLKWMEKTGAAIVKAGYHVVSGNAVGADQAWVRGANSVDPTKVRLCLPWLSYETAAIHPQNAVTILDEETPRSRRYFDRAEAVHDAWRQMTPGGQRLHARNAMIVEGALAVFGYNSGGGTHSAFKIAELLGITTYNVRNPSVRLGVMEIIESERKARK